MDHSFELLLQPDQAKLRKKLLKSCHSNFFVTSLEKEKSPQHVIDAAREWQSNLRAFLETVKDCEIAQEECIVLQTEVEYWRKKYNDAEGALTALRASGGETKLTDADFFSDDEGSQAITSDTPNVDAADAEMHVADEAAEEGVGAHDEPKAAPSVP